MTRNKKSGKRILRKLNHKLCHNLPHTVDFLCVTFAAPDIISLKIVADVLLNLFWKTYKHMQ